MEAEDGSIVDGLVEYCIDFFCGQEHDPAFLHFAMNSVMKEYLYDSRHAPHYIPIPIEYNEHLGLFLRKEHGWSADRWFDCVPNVSVYDEDSDGTTHAEYGDIVSGPVLPFAEPYDTLTDFFCCLLLCRHISLDMLSSRNPTRNNHKEAQDGADKTSL